MLYLYLYTLSRVHNYNNNNNNNITLITRCGDAHSVFCLFRFSEIGSYPFSFFISGRITSVCVYFGVSPSASAVRRSLKREKRTYGVINTATQKHDRKKKR